MVLISPNDECFVDANMELHRIRVDEIAGYLKGGLHACTATGGAIGRLTEMSIDALATRIDTPLNQAGVLDVRDPGEWNVAHIPGSYNIPAGGIARGELPDGDQIAVICGTGYRSSLAARLLHVQGRGKRGVRVIPGGMAAWLEAGLPTNES